MRCGVGRVRAGLCLWAGSWWLAGCLGRASGFGLVCWVRRAGGRSAALGFAVGVGCERWECCGRSASAFVWWLGVRDCVRVCCVVSVVSVVRGSRNVCGERKAERRSFIRHSFWQLFGAGNRF